MLALEFILNALLSLISNIINRICPEYSNRYVCANIVHPDQTPQNASDQGLHCLLLIPQILDTSIGIKMGLFIGLLPFQHLSESRYFV